MDKYTIVIPLYNEENRVEALISKLALYWLLNKEQCEIILVDDGSNDLTIKKVEDAIVKLKDGAEEGFKLVKAQHSGKWGALRKGFLEATGQKVYFLDADLSIGLSEVAWNKTLESDVVFGNRRVHRITGYPFKRTIASRLFSIAVRVLTGLKVHDTQAPFKVFVKNEKVIEAFTEMKETGFIGDVEILVLLRKKKVKVSEVPVRYVYKQSRFKVIENGFKMFGGLLRIVWRG